MTRSHCCSTSNATQSPATALLRDFGPRAAVTCDGVRVLYEALASAPPEVFTPWRAHFAGWANRAVEKAPRCLARLARQYRVAVGTDRPETLLFAMQTYYAILVDQVANRVLPDARSRLAGGELLPGNPFAWPSTVASQPIRHLLDRIAETLDFTASSVAGTLRVPSALCMPSTTDDDGDLFKPLYENLFPRALRHALGEYYTPDWLARHVLDQVGFTGRPGCRLLDPSCGSGTFLTLAIRRIRAAHSHETSPHDTSPSPKSLSFVREPFPVVGFDLNPLAVLTARANWLIAVADLLPETGRIELPVYLCDSIVGNSLPPCAAVPFDFVVGNPPWIAWDNLPDTDRTATKPLWERLGLFSLSGNEARHGGGKKDLSMLMLYVAADRYLKPAGRLGMVITQTIFQSKGAGDGFRRFRLGPDGPPLRVLRVDDMTDLRPFDAANWTSVITLEKGEPTEYPVRYLRWKERKDDGCGRTAAEFLAHPIDPARPNSPWLVLPKTTSVCDGAEQDLPQASSLRSTFFRLHPSHYTAHLGANSGGANGVYWVELLGRSADGVRIRNMAGKGKRSVESVEATIEPDLLYPLLRWSDVGRWSAVPSGHILLAQDPATRLGIAPDVMRAQYPRTLAYLERFRDLLADRAAYRRYQQAGPFYSMYNVGPYTVAPVKVVWRRMDRRIRAAVIETLDDARLGRRPIVPQETCVVVACDTADEAHYLCAALNSEIVGDLVSAASVRGGKGFGTPGMLQFVGIPQFCPNDPRHVELSALSRAAHSACSEQVQRDIDRMAAETLQRAK